MCIHRKNAVAQCWFCGYHNKTKSDRAERELRHRSVQMIGKGGFTMQTGKRTFKHLSRNDRLRIEKWQRMGMKPREIAEKLRVHISTVYRELKRGEYGKSQALNAHNFSLLVLSNFDNPTWLPSYPMVGSLCIFLFSSPCSALLTPSPLECLLCCFFLLRAQSDLSQALPEHDLTALVP